MNATIDPDAQDTLFDKVLAFTVPHRNARGRVVRLGPVLDSILSTHTYPAPIRNLLSEALVLTALMGSLMKDDASQVTLQAQAENGAVSLLVCDYRAGELRGYVQHDAELLTRIGANPSLQTLFGKGYLAITFDLASSSERYQGIVPLEGDSLAQACEAYFEQSEQLPTLLRLGIQSVGGRTVAGGLIVQHFPEGEEGRERLHVKDVHEEWEHVAVLAGSTRYDELVEEDLALEQLVWRLFHEEQEVRVEPRVFLSKGCRCTVEHYQTILSRFPEIERIEMRGDDGLIAVDCAFCSKILAIPA